MTKKLKGIITLTIIVLSIMTACSSEETMSDEGENNTPEAQYHKISPEEAKEMMVEGNMILDVRTQEEYDSGHIEGARLVPIDDILANQFEQLPDKDQVILVYCRSGNRSEVASRHLVENGYTQIYDFGGIIDWPYETVNE